MSPGYMAEHFFFKVMSTHADSTVMEIKTLELGNEKDKGNSYSLIK